MAAFAIVKQSGKWIVYSCCRPAEDSFIFSNVVMVIQGRPLQVAHEKSVWYTPDNFFARNSVMQASTPWFNNNAILPTSIRMFILVNTNRRRPYWWVHPIRSVFILHSFTFPFQNVATNMMMIPYRGNWDAFFSNPICSGGCGGRDGQISQLSGNEMWLLLHPKIICQDESRFRLSKELNYPQSLKNEEKMVMV